MEQVKLLTTLCEASPVIREEVVRQLLQPVTSSKPATEVVKLVSSEGGYAMVGQKPPVWFDELLPKAMVWVTSPKGRASISAVQREFKIGFERAARFIDYMEDSGFITAKDESNGPRKVLRVYKPCEVTV